MSYFKQLNQNKIFFKISEISSNNLKKWHTLMINGLVCNYFLLYHFSSNKFIPILNNGCKISENCNVEDIKR